MPCLAWLEWRCTGRDREKNIGLSRPDILYTVVVVSLFGIRFTGYHNGVSESGHQDDRFAEEVLLKGSEADQNNPAVLADVQDKLNWILDWF